MSTADFVSRQLLTDFINSIETVRDEVEGARNDLDGVIDNLSDLLNLEGNISAVVAVNAALSAVNAVNDKLTEIENVDGKLTEIEAVAGELTAIEAVFNNLQAILDAEGFAQDAESAATVALASSNFKGLWSELSGSLDVPASVFHDSEFWILLENLADVTASEPGEDPEWQILETSGAAFNLIDEFGSESTEDAPTMRLATILNNTKSDKRIDTVDINFADPETPYEVDQDDEDKLLIAENEGDFLFEEDTYEPGSVFLISKDTSDAVGADFESGISTIPDPGFADGIVVNETEIILVYFIEQNTAWIITPGVGFADDISNLQTRVGTLESNEFKHRGARTYDDNFTLQDSDIGRVILIDTSSDDVECTIEPGLTNRGLTTFYHEGENDFSFIEGSGVEIKGNQVSQGEGFSMSLSVFDADVIILSGGIDGN